MYWVSRAGLLVPDIPLEETGPVRQVATAAGLELVLLTTPTTPLERMEAIAKVSQGFVYLVSVTGTPPQPVASLCLLSVAMASSGLRMTGRANQHTPTKSIAPVALPS